MKKFLFLALFNFMLISSCITPEAGFVNYKKAGNVYTTIPQAKKYDEIGAIQTTQSGHIWDSCDDVCSLAIQDLKLISKAHGGNSIIDVKFKGQKMPSKTPVCLTNWIWSVFYGVGMLAPWVKSCHVSGISTFSHDDKKQQSVNKITGASIQ